MSAFVEQCNRIASAWWEWTSQATAQGVILLVLVLVLVALWRRAAPTFRYGLFLLVLAKFLVPPMVCTSLGLFAWLVPSDDPAPAMSESSTITIVQSQPQDDTFVPLPVETASYPEAESPTYALTPASWALAAQCLGTVVFLLFILSRVRALSNLLRVSRRLESGSLHDRATALGRRMGLRQIPTMYLSAQTVSPQSGGLVRPFIVLPEWVETMTPGERDILIAHELAHVSRRDGMVNWFQAFVQTLLWWNPAIWWVNKRIRAERELCCDDLVLAHGITEGPHYSRMLVVAAEHISSPSPSLAVIGMADSFQSIDRRVRRALDPRPKRSMRVSVISVMILLALGAWALPGAAPDSVDGAPSQPETDSVETNVDTPSDGPSALSGDEKGPSEDKLKFTNMRGDSLHYGSADSNVPGKTYRYSVKSLVGHACFVIDLPEETAPDIEVFADKIEFSYGKEDSASVTMTGHVDVRRGSLLISSPRAEFIQKKGTIEFRDATATGWGNHANEFTAERIVLYVADGTFEAGEGIAKELVFSKSPALALVERAQVNVEVRIAEIDLDAGFFLGKKRTIQQALDVTAGVTKPLMPVVDSFADKCSELERLVKLGKAEIVAHPRMTLLENEEGKFMSGQEVPTMESGELEYVAIGTQIGVTARASSAADTRFVTLDTSFEFSELLGNKDGDLLTPDVSRRRFQETRRLEQGETMVFALPPKDGEERPLVVLLTADIVD